MAPYSRRFRPFFQRRWRCALQQSMRAVDRATQLDICDTEHMQRLYQASETQNRMGALTGRVGSSSNAQETERRVLNSTGIVMECS